MALKHQSVTTSFDLLVLVFKHSRPWTRSEPPSEVQTVKLSKKLHSTEHFLCRLFLFQAGSQVRISFTGLLHL